MALGTAEKARNAEIIKKFGKKGTDTGLPEVQVALLSGRINELNSHFTQHPKDFHSQRGLLHMVGKRRRLLNYLRKSSPDRYSKLLEALSLRK